VLRIVRLDLHWGGASGKRTGRSLAPSSRTDWTKTNHFSEAGHIQAHKRRAEGGSVVIVHILYSGGHGDTAMGGSREGEKLNSIGGADMPSGG
jgi:hypothetical protein